MSESSVKPLSYIKWLKTLGSVNASESTLFDDYSEYVKEFYKDQNKKFVDEKQAIVEQYIELLKDITINYVSVDERRFLSNIDYSNKQELDIILPFYVKRIRQITSYLSKQRQKISTTSVKNNFKGSLKGVDLDIKNQIFDIIQDEDFRDKNNTSFLPALSSIINNVTVDIIPLYDLYQSYFDVDPQIDKSVYTESENEELIRLFSANVIEREPLVYLSLLEAVNFLYSKIPDILLTTTSLNITTSDGETLGGTIRKTVDDIPDLPLKFFIENDRTEKNLITEVQREISRKFTSTDVYFLSTGSTTTDYVSGILYEAENPVGNVLNRFWSTRAVVPNKINLKTEKSIGLFFTPSKQGILTYESIDFFYDLNEDNLLPNSIYVFPDPEKTGTGRGLSKTDQFPAFNHTDKTEKIKSTRLNHSKEGEITNNKNLQQFYPYQSREESLHLSNKSVSRSSDDFDFWSGDEKDIWSNKDVYNLAPLLDPPFDEKINDLLISDKLVYEWKSDIFGNSFALFKEVKPIRKTSEQIAGTSSISEIQDSSSSANKNLYGIGAGAFDDQKTPYYNYQSSDFVTKFSSVTDNLTAAKNNYERLTTQGNLIYRNPYSTKIDPVSSSLSAVFLKYEYDDNIINEIRNNVVNFDIIKDVIIIETSNFLIVEQYEYNLETTTFRSVLPYTNFLSISGGSNLEKFGNIYYDESTYDIFLTKTVLHPHLSGSNSKIIYPNIFKFNLSTRKYEEVFSLKTLLISQSSNNLNEHDNTFRFLSGQGFIFEDAYANTSQVSASQFNIIEIDKPNVSINDFEKTLSINYFARDFGNSVLLYNQYFDVSVPDKILVKKLDVFIPNLDSFTFNTDHFYENIGTSTPNMSSYSVTLLRRNESVDRRNIMFDSVKPEIEIEGIDTFDMTFNSSLSGRINSPSKTFDLSNKSVRMGVGVSANVDDELQPDSDPATYTHNASYLLFSPVLSGTNNDISVTFEFAMYTLTSGGSGYAQINLDKTL